MYLNCKTFFSFRYGTYETEELVKTAAGMGVKALAITNINNTCDAWDFYDFCIQSDIHPVLGAEIRNGDEFCYILLAKNIDGFAEINRFLSIHLQQKKLFPSRALLPVNVLIIYEFGKIFPHDLKPNEYIGVRPAESGKLFTTNVYEHVNKFVVRQPVTVQDKKHHNLHRLFRAIDKNILLSKQQRSETAAETETFIWPAEIQQAFMNYPELPDNTEQLLLSCNIELDFKPDKNKKEFTRNADEDRRLLEKLARDGLSYRYHKNNSEAEQRVIKELKIIDELGFNAYFLITWDIIRYAQSRGFYYVGRGSGANSIVAYCLRITDVDPIELDLYFERFLNPYRKSPPDFDIDFSWRDRDEVIGYVFKKYGKDHVALLGMHSTFQRDASIRELGKVYGLPKSEIDALVADPKEASHTDRYHRQILQYAVLMRDFPNYLSIHPGGMLISEKPIYTYTSVDLPPKGFTSARIDMFVAEKINLSKLDLLSQRGLGHIKDCIQLVKENKNISIDIHQVEKFKKDPKLADKIREADTVGCFYIESPAMRQLLKKLRCDDYLTLVAASSIIRPGVAQSGMMRQYIYRFHNPDKFEYLHPKMEELLKETYGVMVYQEDVIKVAHHFAGLDMGEADILRRAMSGKYRTNNRFYLIKENFFRNCKNLGYADEVAAEVWRQMESFGGYSFSKAHSASFAVESYQSLHLKTYYPMEFMVAVINNFGGFYNRELYFHELKRTGAKLLAPCINHSEYITSIKGIEVYVGFQHIEGLEEELCKNILEERKIRGPFLHLSDFIERTCIALEQLNILVRIGALRFTGKNKKELLWEANFLQKKNKRHIPAAMSMFSEKPMTFSLPVLSHHPLDDAYDEIELLGFPLCDPWEIIETDPHDFLAMRDLPRYLNREIAIIGHYVTVKFVRTSRGDTMHFGTFLDKNGEWLDTVHFPQSVKAYPLQGKGYYALYGKVVEEFGIYSVEVNRCEKLGVKSRY